MDHLIIGSRSSKLALWQANFVKDALQKNYPHLKISIVEINTKGDKILDVPLAKIGGKGLFTKELEEDLLKGKIHLAVHSLKDMSTELPEGLCIGAITKRENPFDAFVSNKYPNFLSLPKGSILGTSSLRRKAQLLNLRPDLVVKDLRGNVETRLKKIDKNEYDAIILAKAGLLRLGYHNRIKETLDYNLCLPAVGQGALAIEICDNNEEIKRLISPLNDEDTYYCAMCERSFLSVIEGGCQVPVGVYAQIVDDNIVVTGAVASLDGTVLYKESMTDEKTRGKILGEQLAHKLLKKGGLKILQEIGLCTTLK